MPGFIEADYENSVLELFRNMGYQYAYGPDVPSKQKLLMQLYDQNPGHRWLHFGDLDPDGFYILDS